MCQGTLPFLAISGVFFPVVRLLNTSVSPRLHARQIIFCIAGVLSLFFGDQLSDTLDLFAEIPRGPEDAPLMRIMSWITPSEVATVVR